MSGVRRSRLAITLALVLVVASACATDKKPPREHRSGHGGQARTRHRRRRRGLEQARPAAEGQRRHRLRQRQPAGVRDPGRAGTRLHRRAAPRHVVGVPGAQHLAFPPPRAGCTFHNGAPFDAAAVADNVNEAVGRYDQLTALGPDSATVVDDFTVDLTPTEPNLRLVEQLVHPLLWHPGPGHLRRAGHRAREHAPPAPGRSSSASYRKGEQLEVIRFDGYWGAKAKTEKITFRFLPDDNARVLALKAGEVDAIYDFPREQATQFANDPDITTVKSAPGAYSALLLNHQGQAALRHPGRPPGPAGRRLRHRQGDHRQQRVEGQRRGHELRHPGPRAGAQRVDGEGLSLRPGAGPPAPRRRRVGARRPTASGPRPAAGYS